MAAAAAEFERLNRQAAATEYAQRTKYALPPHFIDRNPLSPLDHLTHARKFLAQASSAIRFGMALIALLISAHDSFFQVYYRQNLMVLSSNYYDARDTNYFLFPLLIITGAASFFGFAASANVIANEPRTRTIVSLTSGCLGLIAATIQGIRSATKFDVKAEMFRSAACQYRLMATRLEQRLRMVIASTFARLSEGFMWQFPRHCSAKPIINLPPFFNIHLRFAFWCQHRMVIHELPLNSEARRIELSDFNTFFGDNYRIMLTFQSEMKYFPPVSELERWTKTRETLPSEVDQPDIDRQSMIDLVDYFSKKVI